MQPLGGRRAGVRKSQREGLHPFGGSSPEAAMGPITACPPPPPTPPTPADISQPPAEEPCHIVFTVSKQQAEPPPPLPFGSATFTKQTLSGLVWSRFLVPSGLTAANS